MRPGGWLADGPAMAERDGHGARLSRWLWPVRPWRATEIIWLIVLMLIALTTGNPFGSASLRAYRLATQGKKIAGTVTALNLSNHGGCHYAYMVDGVQYARSETLCGSGNRVGTGLIVTYLPSNPKIATSGDPRTEWRDDLLFIFIAPSLLAGLFYITRRGRRTPHGL